MWTASFPRSRSLLTQSTMSQYAHYAVGTPEVNAAVAKLPPIPQFEDIHSAREGFGKAFDKVQEQQEVLLPPGHTYSLTRKDVYSH